MVHRLLVHLTNESYRVGREADSVPVAAGG